MADPSTLERPLPSLANAPAFGSDVIAETLRALDIPYIALNPGASYRGLHDSLVNYLGNRAPQMLLCLHEESAVAIAHGYAKVTGKAMAAAVHSNVGLMHATHGDLQRLVRPHAGAGARRHRPGRCGRSGGRGSTGSTPRATRARWCATSPNGTTSRPRPAPRARRCCAPLACADRADGAGLHQPRCRGAGGEARRAAAADRRRALHAAGGRARPSADAVDEGRGAAEGAPRRRDADRAARRATRTPGTRAWSSPRRSTRASSPT